MNAKSQSLLQKLDELAKASGFVVFTIGDHYVQFAKDSPGDPIVFEAVSHNFVETVSRELGNHFATIGFKLETENYFKEIVEKDFSNTLIEVEKIFRDLYRVDYSQPFDITEDIY